jgi:hypothetical protein
MPLPSVQSSIESFGANDTSYIHLNPDWDAATIGYNSPNPMTPTDIAIGDDEYIFVADSANGQIITLFKSGILASQQKLNTIKPVPGPIGIDINAKLNLLIVNGTNIIYCWDQYLNNIGANYFLRGTTADSNLIFSNDYAKIDSLIRNVVDSLVSGNRPPTDLVFSNDESYLDSISNIHEYFVDDDLMSSFQGIAFGPSADNTVFVTDKGNNRIFKLKLIFSGLLVLNNGYPNLTFRAVYDTAIATYGSGAGTVDNPRGITTDNDGNVYFTQLGGNFFVQKLEKHGDQYISAYTLYEDPIMDLNRFIAPYDIALGESDAIFVVDTGDSGRVSKFYNRGVQSGKIANIGRKGLVEARFKRPRGITISNEEIVYITNTGKNRIERFQFSKSDDDIPGDDEN